MDGVRAAALAARQAGDHLGAMRHWRALLDGAPDDWLVALELKRDIRAAGQYPDSDARFRRAARGLPDGEWLQHYANLYAFHADDLVAIEARARSMLADRAGEVRLHAILGEVARQRRDWAGAEAAFGAAAALAGTPGEYAHQAAAARLYARLAGRGWPGAHAGCGADLSVVVVNLDRNVERLAEMRRQLAGLACAWARQAAVDGRTLPGIAAARLTGDALAARGTLGCFLSHVAVWEALVAGGGEALLVMEDDAIPLLDLPARLGGLGLPEGWDVIWVNDRMERRLDPDLAAGFTTHALAAAMQAMDPENNACGTDGYLISRAGARKLLDWVAVDGMAHDVDWRLVAYGMGQGDLDGMPAGSVARQVLTPMIAAIPRGERLRAYVLHPALIRTVGVSSDREDANRLLAD